MDQILDIQLTFVGNELVIQDNTDTTILPTFNADDYVSVDFFINANGDVASVIYGKPKESVSTSIHDGKHIHRKLWIPKRSSLTTSSVNEIFYLDGKIYQIKDSQGAYKEISIIDASEYIDSGAATQTWFSATSTVFCTSKLRTCVVELQKQVIELCHKCANTDSIRVKRDFLFNALYVIDYLKDTGNLDEAQRILDNLSYCGFICDDIIITNGSCCG